MLLDQIVKKIKQLTGDSILDEIAIVVLIIALTESIAQNNLKNRNLLTGMFVYMGVGYVLHYSYHYYALSKVNIMWSSISIILATLLGYMLYNEKLTKDSFIAMGFALLAVYFSNRSDNNSDFLKK
jgi:drug/metabolite transporter (DMT)-like permease